MNRFLNVFPPVVLVLLLIIFTALFVYWSYFDLKNPIITTNGQDATVEKPIKRGGSYLPVHRGICASERTIAILDRAIVDGMVYTLPSVHVVFEEGCTEKIHWIEIPRIIPEGDYQFRERLTFAQNPLRVNETIDLPIIFFEIEE